MGFVNNMLINFLSLSDQELLLPHVEHLILVLYYGI